MQERSRIEYRFWKQGIDFVIPGYSDVEFTSSLSMFVFSVNFSELTPAERELIFSEPLKRDPISRKV